MSGQAASSPSGPRRGSPGPLARRSSSRPRTVDRRSGEASGPRRRNGTCRSRAPLAGPPPVVGRRGRTRSCRSCDSATGTRVRPLRTRHRAWGRGGTGSARAPRADPRTRRPSRRHRSVQRAVPPSVGTGTCRSSVPVPRRKARSCERREQVQPAAGWGLEHRELGVEDEGLSGTLGSTAAPNLRRRRCHRTARKRPDRRTIERKLVERPGVVRLGAGVGEQQVLDPVGCRPTVGVSGLQTHAPWCLPSALRRSPSRVSSSHVSGISYPAARTPGAGYQTRPLHVQLRERAEEMSVARPARIRRRRALPSDTRYGLWSALSCSTSTNSPRSTR